MHTDDERLAPLLKLKGMEKTHLLISEIYPTLQGESSHAGRPCVLIRTTACNLRCRYCDTAYAFTGGRPMALSLVIEKALGYEIKLIEVTGGEPLLQPLVPALCQALLDARREVLVETGGSLDISVLPKGVRTILDIKTPESGEEPANLYANLQRLRPGDEVKFVLCSMQDYVWAREMIRRENLEQRTTVLISPVHGGLAPSELAAAMLADRLDARLSLQLHKSAWPETEANRKDAR